MTGEFKNEQLPKTESAEIKEHPDLVDAKKRYFENLKEYLQNYPDPIGDYEALLTLNRINNAYEEMARYENFKFESKIPIAGDMYVSLGFAAFPRFYEEQKKLILTGEEPPGRVSAEPENGKVEVQEAEDWDQKVKQALLERGLMNTDPEKSIIQPKLQNKIIEVVKENPERFEEIISLISAYVITYIFYDLNVDADDEKALLEKDPDDWQKGFEELLKENETAAEYIIKDLDQLIEGQLEDIEIFEGIIEEKKGEVNRTIEGLRKKKTETRNFELILEDLKTSQENLADLKKLYQEIKQSSQYESYRVFWQRLMAERDKINDLYDQFLELDYPEITKELMNDEMSGIIPDLKDISDYLEDLVKAIEMFKLQDFNLKSEAGEPLTVVEFFQALLDRQEVDDSGSGEPLVTKAGADVVEEVEAFSDGAEVAIDGNDFDFYEEDDYKRKRKKDWNKKKRKDKKRNNN